MRRPRKHENTKTRRHEDAMTRRYEDVRSRVHTGYPRSRDLYRRAVMESTRAAADAGEGCSPALAAPTQRMAAIASSSCLISASRRACNCALRRSASRASICRSMAATLLDIQLGDAALDCRHFAGEIERRDLGVDLGSTGSRAHGVDLPLDLRDLRLGVVVADGLLNARNLALVAFDASGDLRALGRVCAIAAGVDSRDGATLGRDRAAQPADVPMDRRDASAQRAFLPANGRRPPAHPAHLSAQRKDFASERTRLTVHRRDLAAQAARLAAQRGKLPAGVEQCDDGIAPALGSGIEWASGGADLPGHLFGAARPHDLEALVRVPLARLDDDVARAPHPLARAFIGAAAGVHGHYAHQHVAEGLLNQSFGPARRHRRVVRTVPRARDLGPRSRLGGGGTRTRPSRAGGASPLPRDEPAARRAA